MEQLDAAEVVARAVEMYVILLDLTMSSAIYHFDKCCNIWLINSITRTSSSASSTFSLP